MRDETHEEHITRWAVYVRDHPSEWKSQLKPFLDSQITMANRVLRKLPKEKVMEIKGID